MALYETISKLTFATIDLIAFEILLSGIFIVQNDQIKFTFDWLFKNLSKYRKTAYFVYPVIFLGIVYFYTSNILQDLFVAKLTTVGWKTIPSFLLAISFASFWITKVTLGRKLNFPLVYGSIIAGVISAILLSL